MNARILIALDALQQLAEAAVVHQDKAQTLAAANEAVLAAVASRSNRIQAVVELLDGLALRLKRGRISKVAHKRLLALVAQMMRDQVNCDDACVDLIDKRLG